MVYIITIRTNGCAIKRVENADETGKRGRYFQGIGATLLRRQDVKGGKQ